MESNSPTTSQSDFLRQALKGLLVLTGLMVLGFILIVVLGKFRVEYEQNMFALKDPSYRQLPSYYNPLWSLLAALQYFALLVQPFVLFIFRKQLRLKVLPWVFLLILVVLFITIVSLTASPEGPDPTLTSNLPTFLQFQLFIVIAAAISQYGSYRFAFRKQVKEDS
ncbi:MAG TPA: hypothetical protein VK694_01335 [Verrucomicrobiae bacterium]|nr:hypothetical protein [Verrucomicrobiae bacterium]